MSDELESRNRLSSTARLRLAAAIAVVGVAAAVAGITATIGGGASPRSAAARASGVDSVLAQVQSAFHDGRLIAASIQGAGLTVTLPTTGPAAMHIGTFEGQVLAYAVNDRMQANNQEPISFVSYVDSAGRAIQDTSPDGDVVGSLPSAPALAAGACEAAATPQRRLGQDDSLCRRNVRDNTPDLGRDGLRRIGRSLMGTVQHAVPDAGDHPLLVEVDAQSGNPLVVTPGVLGRQASLRAGPGSGPASTHPSITTEQPEEALGIRSGRFSPA